MQLFRARNWTSDIDELISWQKNGVPRLIRGPKWFGLYKRRGWELHSLGHTSSKNTLFELLDWDTFWDFEKTKNSTAFKGHTWDTLRTTNLFGVGQWIIICQWWCYMDHIGGARYMSQKRAF